MHPHIAAINTIYSQAQDYIDPMDLALLGEMIFAGHFAEKREQFRSTYEVNRNKLWDILTQMSPQEIGEAYIEGCRLLQRNLSGYMLNHWDAIYLPVLEHAIRKQHGHTGWMFLQKLADYDISAYETLVIGALEYEGFQETALSIVRRYKLTKASDKIKTMIDTNTLYVDTSYAVEVLKDISS